MSCNSVHMNPFNVLFRHSLIMFTFFSHVFRGDVTLICNSKQQTVYKSFAPVLHCHIVNTSSLKYFSFFVDD